MERPEAPRRARHWWCLALLALGALLVAGCGIATYVALLGVGAWIGGIV